jgi:dihydrolipoamide dehydrogenase
MHVVIIGAYGSAGAAVADRLAGADEDVQLTLIDDGDPGGGLCILRGCMPSKEVLSAGAHRFQVRHDERLTGVPEVDADTVVERKNDHTLSWAAHRREAIHELAEHDGIEFVHDTATFVDDRTVRAGGRTFEADYVVVATGSIPNVPNLEGIGDVDFFTSDEVLEMSGFPDSGLVMGFGFTGMELAPYLSEVGGVDVTVVEHDARPLDEADPAFGDALVDLYEAAFDVDILPHTGEQRVEPTEDGGVRLEVDQEGEAATLEAEALFLFTGRQANLPGGLAETSLTPEEEWVRATMQARGDDRVFVVGDVNAKDPVLHVAKEQGFTAARNIRRFERGDDPVEYHHTHHHVIFTGLGVYPYARVGHSRESAAREGLEFVHVERQASDDGVFKTKSNPEGLASLVVGDDGTVLGYQGLHLHADVMAKTMQVVVENGMDVRDVPDRAYHPTTPEIVDGLVRDAKDELAFE